jgi:tRNA-specific 2-thiouridylase
MTFSAGRDPGGPFRAGIRIRHRAALLPAAVHPDPAIAGRWLAELEADAWAPAPGQAAVCYDGDVVIGGGRIAPDASPAIDRAQAHPPEPVAAVAGTARQ